MEGYIGEIRLFAANFAPRNWAYCQGQIMSIASNSALFSILGTTYGGNGSTTFGLPDFRSRTARGASNSTVLGEMGGSESVTLTVSQIPSHNHTATGAVNPPAYNSGGGDSTPGGNAPAMAPSNMYASTADADMGANHPIVTVQPSGSTMPHPNIQPSLGMNYVICMFGIYPSRN